MRILDQGTVFAGKAGSEYAKTCFPFMTRLSNGELLASFQAATVKNGIDSKAVLVRSADKGKTWGAPACVFDPVLDGKNGTLHLAYITELEPGKLVASILWCDHLGDGKLEFFNPQTGGLLPTDACVSFSEDNGYTWSGLRRIEKGPFEGTPTPVMGPIQKLNESILICPFETSKKYEDAGQWQHHAAYFISRDGGLTWPEQKTVAHDPQCRIFYWDHRIANLGNGRLVDFFWAFDATENRELNVHFSVTLDYGLTWSQPKPTSLVGQPWPISIRGEFFAVVLVDRNISRTIKLYETKDGGMSFESSEPLTVYSADSGCPEDGSLNEQLVEMGNWCYGLPSGCLLADGTVMITYYAGNDKSTDIKWCRVEI
jgi:hypothetical protein